MCFTDDHVFGNGAPTTATVESYKNQTKYLIKNKIL